MTACIACGFETPRVFLDLGKTPLANAYLDPGNIPDPEPVFPLRVAFCPHCFLVHLPDRVDPAEMFSHYLYFSSVSPAFVAHAGRMVETLIRDLGLKPGAMVVELASNDGYLLRQAKEKGMRVLGVDPAENIAGAANDSGVPTRCAFFSLAEARKMVEEGIHADLVIGNNVLAHVPDPVDFLKGAALLIGKTGAASFEFPHLLELLNKVEFDTIYHEHVSYLSLMAIQGLAARAGLAVVDVSRQPVHGGSIRVILRGVEHHAAGTQSPAVAALLREEREAGLGTCEAYERFGEKVQKVIGGLQEFLSAQKAAGKRVAAYGAAAKGNTLLNVAGVKAGDMVYVADRSPHKSGKVLPGSHLPVVPAERLAEDMPDYVVLLAWNFEEEIRQQQAAYLAGGGKFAVPVPVLKIDG